MNPQDRFTLRKAALRSKTGDERWVIYDDGHLTSYTIERDHFYARNHYRLLRYDEYQKTFHTLKEARLWFNRSELERFVAAIEG